MSEVILTNETYRRWLRAQRPQPIQWFLSLGPDDQEALAGIGDTHAAEATVALAYALIDPDLADAGLDAPDNPESEEVLLRRLAANAAREKLQNGPGSPPPTPPLSMGGLTKRQHDAESRKQAAKDGVRRLFGRPPDGGGE